MSSALLAFMHQPVSNDMVDALVTATLSVVPCRSTYTAAYPSPPASPSTEGPRLCSLKTFITTIVKSSKVYTGTLMATLAYLHRLRALLPLDANGLPCTRHRIFLACLIVSAKFHNDASPKNAQWAAFAGGIFDVTDLNLMERQLIALLNWDLRVEAEELSEHLHEFLEPLERSMAQARRLKRAAAQRVTATLGPPPIIYSAAYNEVYPPVFGSVHPQDYRYAPTDISPYVLRSSSVTSMPESMYSVASLRSSLSYEDKESYMTSHLYAQPPLAYLGPDMYMKPSAFPTHSSSAGYPHSEHPVMMMAPSHQY